MRALILVCHPRADSFTMAVRDVAVARLRAAGAEIRLRDLYAEGFEPRLSGEGLGAYLDTQGNAAAVARDVADLRWCDTLVFVYPTWWYGLPAMLKGWLDRALVPGVAFHMPGPQERAIRPGLQHITRLGAFTTCGASALVTALMGAPGRRTLLRGVRAVCARRCRTAFAAHYRMDSSTPESRAAHLERVARAVDRLAAGAEARALSGQPA